jgi:2-hydroxychromene-2-carboxylate isomerase
MLPHFYFDIASGWAWLAAERIRDLIPKARWEPVFLPALLQLNGRESWVVSSPAERDRRLAELTERARGYGLAPDAWPEGYPLSLVAVQRPREWLRVQRAAVAACATDRGREFTLAAFRATHIDGRDLTLPAEIAAVAASVGLDGDALAAAGELQSNKDTLRTLTEQAHAAGAPGVPTVVVAGRAFWGDDRLAEAAAASETTPA